MARPNFFKSPPFPRPASSLHATSSLPLHDPGDDLYEGYNDYDPQLHSGLQSQIGGESKPDSIGIYDLGPVYSRSPLKSQIGLGESKADSIASYDQGPVFSRSSSASDIQGQRLDPFSRSLTPHTTASMLWRPPSTSMSSRAQQSPYASTESSRPMTGVRAAGYSSRGSKFDPMNQGSKISTPGARKKEETNPEYQCREMERAVNQVLEASAAASLAIACGSRGTSKQLFKKPRKQARRKGTFAELGSKQGWVIK